MIAENIEGFLRQIVNSLTVACIKSNTIYMENTLLWYLKNRDKLLIERNIDNLVVLDKHKHLI